ncbi:MAG: phenylalanine--tRNA ligase subunit beta [Pseudomonadota bacterium]
MKFTFLWLKDHLDTTASVDEIVQKLTAIGLEVETVEDKAKALKDFKIAHVVSAEKHPNADRLRLCMVDVGESAPIQVVCGAPNARAGMKTVFAAPGTYIPGKDFTIDVGTIRGVESRGMLCSADELNIGGENDGILDLPQDAPVGTNYAEWAGLDDSVIEIALTPNRPDCTGVRGIARDLAATEIGDLKPAEAKPVKGSFANSFALKIELDHQPHWCPAFALRLLKNVKNGASPVWMQKRLQAIGLRPINALVDLTNYFTFDIARPLHVFDADKVKGALVVRAAKKDETFEALDGKTYTLDESMCVIADDSGVISLAGIMGGKATGCDENTKNVLIECALWDPLNIAQTGRKLGVSSDARYRFERGVDPQGVANGIECASSLAIEMCGGDISDITWHKNIADDNRIIIFSSSEVKRLTGADLLHQEIKIILERLGFWLSGDHAEWRVAPPSWRPDIYGKADLVEEVIRIAGLDRVMSTRLPAADSVNAPVLTLPQKRKTAAQRVLAARGLCEAVTWSFISEPQAKMFGGGQDELKVANPISVEMAVMRPSLLPGLIMAARQNEDRGVSHAALFEVGQVFKGLEPKDQFVLASGLRGQADRHWSRKETHADVFDAKADCVAVLSALGAPDNIPVTRDAPSWFHPGRSGTFRLGPNVIAHFGELHPAIVEHHKLSSGAAAFEIFIDALPVPKTKPTRTKPKLALSVLQPLRRDFAFTLDEHVEAAEVLKAARGADKALITDVTVFDVYQGAGIPSGKKSLAIEVTLQPQDKTLTEPEIDAVAQKIIAAVTKATGASLRS